MNRSYIKNRKVYRIWFFVHFERGGKYETGWWYQLGRTYFNDLGYLNLCARKDTFDLLACERKTCRVIGPAG